LNGAFGRHRGKLSSAFELSFDQISHAVHAQIILTGGAFKDLVVVAETDWAEVSENESFFLSSRPVIYTLQFIINE
jgi:hypothetical protein